MNNKRLVSTPNVEIGSPQYNADAALMKLFDSYWEYLEYEADWQKDWTSYHPSIAPTVTYPADFCCEVFFLELFGSYEEYLDALHFYYCNNSRAIAFFLKQFVDYEEYLSYLAHLYVDHDRLIDGISAVVPVSKNITQAYHRKNTAMRHKPGKKLLDSLQKKPSSGKRGALPYKRCRILQPQCIDVSYVYFGRNDNSGNIVAIQSLGSSHVYPTLPEYIVPFEVNFEDFDLEVSGLRVSEQPAKHGKSSMIPQKTSDLLMEKLYELRLIMLAIPGISKDTAKAIQQLIYSYLEGNGKKSEDENLLDYLCPLVRPDLRMDNVSSMEKVLSLSTFRAYKEVKRLVDAVTFVDLENFVSDVEENKPAHSKSKLIPTSDFFPMTADSSEEAADGSSAYVDRRRACVSSTAHRNVSLKETQVHLTMERPNFVPLFF